MKDLKIAVANDRSHILLSWKSHGQWKEVKIPIQAYSEMKSLEA